MMRDCHAVDLKSNVVGGLSLIACGCGAGILQVSCPARGGGRGAPACPGVIVVVVVVIVVVVAVGWAQREDERTAAAVPAAANGESGRLRILDLGLRLNVAAWSSPYISTAAAARSSDGTATLKRRKE